MVDAVCKTKERAGELVATSPATAAPATQSLPNATEPNATDMAGVMDKLAQVRELDPTAEPKLLDQLGKTPPSTWPLVAEQYRASLACCISS